jgi:TldD protein
MFDNGRLKTANFNTGQGFGLRAVAGEATGYAHSSELSHAALLRAADAVSTVKDGYSGTLAEAPPRTNRHLYGEENPTGSPSFGGKAKLLQEIDAWVRAEDPRVRQVTASLVSSWQQVEIVRAEERRRRSNSTSLWYQLAGTADSRRPRAFMTLATVANSGRPSSLKAR